MTAPETNTELRVDKWIYGGDALGRLNGQVVLAPFAIPGEKLRIQLERLRSDLIRASVVEILEASPERVSPKCPYFGSCGGCHYQHASYPAQLEHKVLILRDVFRRIGKIEAPETIRTLHAEPWGYRNRVQLHFQGRQLGYMEAGGQRFRPVDQCPVASPKLQQVMDTLRGMLRERRWPRFLRSMEVFTNEEDVQFNVLESDQPVARRFFDWCSEQIPGSGASWLDYRTSSDVFRVSHRSFFQVNRFLVDALAESALAGARGETAWDLYAGVGLFSLPLARRFRSVTAVESGFGAANDLEFNAQRAGLPLHTRRCTVEDFLDNETHPPDFVLADPPRAGLGKRNVRNLLRLQPRLLTIVACDPATLARDAAALIQGGYRLESLTFIDLFPQTFHLETIAELRRA